MRASCSRATWSSQMSCLFISTAPAPTEIYTLSLHDALPIFERCRKLRLTTPPDHDRVSFELAAYLASLVTNHLHTGRFKRSEEHTSELQSRVDLVCRLLLEKKNNE